MKKPGKTITRGGRRAGAGRKVGGQNAETENRRLSIAWLCEWFGRRLSARLGRAASDADCEQSVNNCFALTSPIFHSQKSTLGGAWAQARRQERPFNSERTAAVVAAADKLKFWDPAWRRSLAKASGESDPFTLLMLSLLAVDGPAEQARERANFKVLKAALQAALSDLKASTSKNFKRKLAVVLAALESWHEFSSVLSAGSVGLQRDLLASELGDDDPGGWVLHPARTIKQLALLSFGQSLDSVEKARAQVWALQYVAHNFSDSRLMIRKVRTLKTGQRLSCEPTNPEADLALNFLNQ